MLVCVVLLAAGSNGSTIHASDELGAPLAAGLASAAIGWTQRDPSHLFDIRRRPLLNLCAVEDALDECQ
jgi:hypothetical protein